MNDIEDKGIIKIIHNGQSAFMHYLLDGDKLTSLTLGDSEKVADFKKENSLELGFGMKPENFNKAVVHIDEDKDRAKKLFDTMLDLKFTHFKTYTDNLVVLEIGLI